MSALEPPICPTVAAMTAAGCFSLDALAEHAKDCPICRPFVAAFTKPVIDVLAAWPPRPEPGKGDKP